MDGSFACPECGSLVEVQGLAPGRQVRCEFCQQLLEVPYLPRVPAGPWKRRRFRDSRWIPWGAGILGIIVAVLLVVRGLQHLRAHIRAAEKGSIQKLLDSSRAHEESGELGQALIDLDVALSLARKVDPADRMSLEEQERRRGDLARRDAKATLDQLARRNPASLPLGEWLNLIARAGRDPDLASLRSAIDDQFQVRVRLAADADLALARTVFESRKVVESLQACDRIAKLLTHLPPDVARIVRRDTEELVGRLLATHGVLIDSPRGAFVYGSQESYLASMLPILLKSLEKKGYLPYRPTSPWGDLWKRSLYRLEFAVTERLEGNYLSSNNRLARIEARLSLTSQGKSLWQTTPTARTAVPLPGLSAYLSGRLATNRERSEEIERMFYQNARDHIEEKFSYALSNMPGCP
jgi:hypothetical protein